MSLHGAGHLGGYIIGGDASTYYPDLWSWLIDEREVETVLDLGCGEGHALSFFRSHGCDVVGVDGIEQPDPDIYQHDFTRGTWPKAPARLVTTTFDLCWSCEFVEHVAEEHLDNFMGTFALARLVLMTHALPKQPGWHHVNCRTSRYWIDKMRGIGYMLDDGLTRQTRWLAAKSRVSPNYYVQSGLAFKRPA